MKNSSLLNNVPTKMERLMKMMDEAEKYGVALSDGSTKKVEDISALAIDEWTKVRKTGIGGSDAGIVFFGANSFKDIEVLAKEKMGLLPPEKVDWKKQVLFDAGHAAEINIANIFEHISGYQVYEDRAMYCHSEYPFMLADTDGIAIDPAGMKVGLEFKYINPDDLKFKWRSGVYGEDAKAGNESYVIQCRHYMSVLNIDRYFLCVWAGNRAEDLVIIRIDRDFSIEKELIDAESAFWHGLERGEIPLCTSHSNEAYKRLTEKADSEIPTKKMTAKPVPCKSPSGDLAEMAKQYIQNQAVIAELKKQQAALEKKQNALLVPFKEAMADADASAIEIVNSDGEALYEITSSSRICSKWDKDKLKTAYPELWKDLISEGIYKETLSSPSLKIKAVTGKE